MEQDKGIAKDDQKIDEALFSFLYFFRTSIKEAFFDFSHRWVPISDGVCVFH